MRGRGSIKVIKCTECKNEMISTKTNAKLCWDCQMNKVRIKLKEGRL